MDNIKFYQPVDTTLSHVNPNAVWTDKETCQGFYKIENIHSVNIDNNTIFSDIGDDSVEDSFFYIIKSNVNHLNLENGDIIVNTRELHKSATVLESKLKLIDKDFSNTIYNFFANLAVESTIYTKLSVK